MWTHEEDGAKANAGTNTVRDCRPMVDGRMQERVS